MERRRRRGRQRKKDSSLSLAPLIRGSARLVSQQFGDNVRAISRVVFLLVTPPAVTTTAAAIGVL